MLGPYIVEKTEDSLDLVVEIPEVTGLFGSLLSKSVICRFNGYWPKPEELHAWIYQNWTQNCDIFLCAKGFFVVQFDTAEDYSLATTEGPWFLGRAGLFINPWFPGLM